MAEPRPAPLPITMTAAERTDLLLAQYMEAHPQAQPSTLTVLELIHWAKGR